jgi:hypothetical protein
MRILTLWQPWASLIALGLKQYETQSWGTTYRGKLAIHAAKRPIVRDELRAIAWAMGGGGCSMAEFAQVEQVLEQDLPLGAIVAIADLSDCLVMRYRHPSAMAGIEIETQSGLEQAVGLWEPSRYVWKLDNVVSLTEPIPFKGGQGLRELPDTAVLQAIAAQGVKP